MVVCGGMTSTSGPVSGPDQLGTTADRKVDLDPGRGYVSLLMRRRPGALDPDRPHHARVTWGIGLAQPGFGRTGVEARSQGYWSGVHQPLLPVDEFANRVEVSGVAGGLSDHMEQDIPNIVQAPLTLGKGPPDQVGIWG
jgi:hypothetical protein